LNFLDRNTSCLSFSIERMPNVDLFDAEDRFELPKLYTWPLPASSH
jgi:hypothetical protein